MTDSEKLDLLLSEMQDMKNDMQIVKADTQELKERVSNVESKTTDISLILENEIRVNILESEVRRIKERIADIA